jgi:predicted transcriptional regulator
MSTDVLLSKSYVQGVFDDYQKIVSQINEIIGQTGSKEKVIAKKSGLPESTFYRKKRNKSFNLDEMKQIAALIDGYNER